MTRPRRQRRSVSPFVSLRNRNFRLFFMGHAVSVIGTWMQRVAQDWLVLELTGSATAVGLAMTMQFLPVLFLGLWGGVVVDRLDRRRLVMVTQLVSAILAAVLAAVVLGGIVELWMIYALAMGLGLVTVFDNPARQSLVAELVGPTEYLNGQALTSTIHNLGRLVGPALAGILIASVGTGVAFAVNALSFVAALIGLARMDQRRMADVVRPAKGSTWGHLREGMAYVLRHPELRATVTLVAVISLFGQNFRVVLPVLAQETFHGDATTYGWLTSALGLGAVVGALATASRATLSGVLLFMAAVSFGIANGLAALAPWLALALLATALIGATNITFNTVSRSLLQLRTDPALHGRVMALHSLLFLGTTPLGAPLLGWVCETWGPRAGFLTASLTAVLAALAVRHRLAPPHGGARAQVLES